MQKASTVSRYLLGLIYFVFGLNGFLQFLPMPPLPESAMSFMGGLAGSGYFFPFLKGTEVVMGALLLAGFAVPLAYIVLAPITINILLFHFILTPGLQNSVLPIFMVILSLVGAYNYKDLFIQLFTTKK
jgi:putative oxidoreductase